MKLYALYRTPLDPNDETFTGLLYRSKQSASDAAVRLMQEQPDVFAWVDTAYVIDEATEKVSDA